MKVSYWYVRCPDDSNVYSIRERTKKAASHGLALHQAEGRWHDALSPVKVVVDYQDGFDLIRMALSEGSLGYEETKAEDTQ